MEDERNPKERQAEAQTMRDLLIRDVATIFHHLCQEPKSAQKTRSRESDWSLSQH